MTYLIETWDKPGSEELRLKIRPSHLEYLDGVADCLLACGAKLAESGVANGGIYLVDVRSSDEAWSIIEKDPFYQAGLFSRINVQPWRKAYFNGERLI